MTKYHYYIEIQAFVFGKFLSPNNYYYNRIYGFILGNFFVT